MKTAKARNAGSASITGSQKLGRWGESLAADYLRSKGYAILGQNVRTAYGELDLVTRQETQHGAVTVFVEVKTRRSGAFGLPEAAITPQKQAHLLAAAQAHLQANPDLVGDWRVDVIAIRRIPGQEVEVVHFENAVQ